MGLSGQESGRIGSGVFETRGDKVRTRIGRPCLFCFRPSLTRFTLHRSSGDIATMKGCLNFLLVSTDPKIWPDAFSKDQAPSRATLLSHLIQIDTYAVLRLILGMVGWFYVIGTIRCSDRSIE